MALAITPANVVPSAAATIQFGTAGVVITAGQVVYLDGNGLLQLADANDAAKYQAIGIACASAAADQPLPYVVSDTAMALGLNTPIYNYFILDLVAGGIETGDTGTPGQYAVLLALGPSTAATVNISALNRSATPQP